MGAEDRVVVPVTGAAVVVEVEPGLCVERGAGGVVRVRRRPVEAGAVGRDVMRGRWRRPVRGRWWPSRPAWVPVVRRVLLVAGGFGVSAGVVASAVQVEAVPVWVSVSVLAAAVGCVWAWAEVRA